MKIVIPSVNYADFLAVTLPQWRRVFPSAEIVIVTSPRDVDTARVAADDGARAHVTDVWYSDGRRFNKGGALDEAFAFEEMRGGELCLSADADGFPFGGFAPEQIQADILYSCPRYHCDRPRLLQAHLDGKTPLTRIPLVPPMCRGKESRPTLPHTWQERKKSARRCLGYFQLFRYRKGLRFGDSKTAGGYDVRFAERFPRRAALMSMYVLHLGGRDRANWAGRTLPKWGAA